MCDLYMGCGEVCGKQMGCDLDRGWRGVWRRGVVSIGGGELCGKKV